jgi:flavin reductase (DIM6/NTAB) family NADH-FMN oxidoreductase RutF
MAKRSLGTRTVLYPLPVLVVGTYDARGVPNMMAAAWGGICCSRPPCVYVSLRPATYTYDAIVSGGCYTISIPSVDYVREADYVGLASGRDVNKFDVLGLTPVRASHVNAPYVAEFPVVLECSLKQTVEIGSHTQFIGEVVDVLVEDTLLEAEGNPDIGRIRPVICDAPGRGYYGLGPFLGEAFSIGRRS